MAYSVSVPRARYVGKWSAKKILIGSAAIFVIIIVVLFFFQIGDQPYQVNIVTASVIIAIICILFQIIDDKAKSNLIKIRHECWNRKWFWFHSHNGIFNGFMNIKDLMRHKYLLLHQKVENQDINSTSFISTAFENGFVDPRDRCVLDNTTLFEKALSIPNVEVLDFLIRHYQDKVDMFSGHEGQNMFSNILQSFASPSFQTPEGISNLVIKLFAAEGIPTDAFAIALDKLPVETCEVILQTFNTKNYVDILHDNGMSPLHIAVDIESLAKVRMLVSHNASVHTWKGLLPSEYAILKDRSLNMIEILVRHEEEDGIYISDERWYILKNLNRLERERKDDKIARSVLKDMVSGGDFRPRSDIMKGSSNSDKQLSFKYDPISPSPNTQMTVRELLAKARRLKSEGNASVHQNSRIAEAKEIHSRIEEFLKFISLRMGAYKFEPELGGSVKENTKIFSPDEFDYVCTLSDDGIDVQYKPNHHPVHVMIKLKEDNFGSKKGEFIDPWRLNRSFVAEVEAITDTLKNQKFSNLVIQHFCVDKNHKVPCLHFRWCGTVYKDLAVSLDLVPAFRIKHDVVKSLKRHLNIDDGEQFLFAIPKGRDPDNDLLWPISFHQIEANLLANLPPFIHNAYVLAKAVRIPEISLPTRDQSNPTRDQNNPNDQNSLRISGILVAQDVITSYMLKTCLLSILSKYSFEHVDDQTDSLNLSIQLALMIFIELEQNIQGRILQPYFSTQEKIALLRCTHSIDSPYKYWRKCCQMSNTALAMCDKIIDFLSRDADILSRDQNNPSRDQNNPSRDQSNPTRDQNNPTRNQNNELKPIKKPDTSQCCHCCRRGMVVCPYEWNQRVGEYVVFEENGQVQRIRTGDNVEEVSLQISDERESRM